MITFLICERMDGDDNEAVRGARPRKGTLEHMDDMLEYFRNLVRVLAPWDADGTPRPDRDQKLWFRAVEVFKNFLALRAPFQTPRLSAVAIVPRINAP